MARKRKTLPKDFADVLTSGDLVAMKAVFDQCELDAHGGYSKQPALAFAECPDDLTRWLVEQGADLEVPDAYGKAPLHVRAGHWRGDVAALLDLGARVARPDRSDTPLHAAARVHNLAAARLLIEHGARVDARDEHGLTPLGAALQHCSNAKLQTMAPIAELLLSSAERGPKPGLFARLTGKARRSEADDPQLQAMVRKLGETFEFHRADFNSESVDAASAALDRLYQLFSVTPVPRRTLHALDKPIATKSSDWQGRHDELWQKLVPGKGAAPTVQGEVIRISGRIADELERNGGVNWDRHYALMADALVRHLASGTPLSAKDLDLAQVEVEAVKRKRGEPALLAELAVRWVELNPQPVELPPPDYDR